MAKKSEHKRQAKLAKQRAKAKDSARKQRQLAAQQSSLQPYEGTRYHAPKWTPITFTIESAIHSVDQMTKHGLTDDDVRAGLRCLIGRLKQGTLKIEITENDQVVLDSEPDKMIADMVGFSLMKRSTLPATSDLIGVARSLLSSVDVWGVKNHSPRGYLIFLQGFLAKATANGGGTGYSASEIVDMYLRSGLATDDDAHEEEEEEG